MNEVGKWIGRRAAEVVAFFRDKPFVPCQVDWYEHNVEAMFATPEQRERVINKRDLLADECGSCRGDCCIATDTLGEWGK